MGQNNGRKIFNTLFLFSMCARQRVARRKKYLLNFQLHNKVWWIFCFLFLPIMPILVLNCYLKFFLCLFQEFFLLKFRFFQQVIISIWNRKLKHLIKKLVICMNVLTLFLSVRYIIKNPSVNQMHLSAFYDEN